MSCNQYYSFYWKGQIMKNHHKIIVLHDISHLKYGGGLLFFEKKDFLGKCFWQIYGRNSMWDTNDQIIMPNGGV